MASIALERSGDRTGGDLPARDELADGFAAADWRAFDTPDMIAAWDNLARQAAEPNPFLESWFLLPSLENFDPDGDCRLLALHEHGRLTGLMPIGRDARYAGRPIPCLVNWAHANMFCGVPLVARGSERAFWQGLLAWADAHCNGALFLHLAHLPAEGPLYAALRDVLAEQGRSGAVVHSEERAMLRSDLAPEDYFVTSMSGKKRKELRRQANRLAEEGTVEFTRQDGPDDLDPWIDAFFTLEQRGWKGEAGSALSCDLRTKAMFRAALTGAAQRGKLERLAIRLDGQPIAMLVNFLTAPGSYSFKTAFDERYARFSPGVLLQRENLALLARPKIAWCDSCAAADHPMIERIWREKRPIVRVSLAIGGPVRRAIFRQLARFETGQPARGL